MYILLYHWLTHCNPKGQSQIHLCEYNLLEQKQRRRDERDFPRTGRAGFITLRPGIEAGDNGHFSG